jgi:DNA transformation protein
MAKAPGTKLKSMRVSDGYRAFALDQLAGVPELRARAMFGGIGLYSGDHFFGLMAADRLYLKVDDRNRADYEAAGMAAFRPYDDRAMTMPYYEVPLAVLEDAATLARWARTSIAVASAKAASRRAPARKRRKA